MPRNAIMQIIAQFRTSLTAVYLLIIMAQLLFLVEPWILGRLIDGLLSGQFIWLWVFIGTQGLGIALQYRRMVFDTIIISRIYNHIVLRYWQRDQHADLSTRIARTDLAHTITNFLESDVHYFIHAGLALVGSYCFIIGSAPITGLVIGTAALPIGVVVWWFWNFIAKATRIGNNHHEQKTQHLSSGIATAETFFQRRRRLLIMQSNLQGRHWAALNSLKVLFMVLALVSFAGNNSNMTQGEAVAMVAYVVQFLNALMCIPVTVEIATRMQDALHRLSAAFR